MPRKAADEVIYLKRLKVLREIREREIKKLQADVKKLTKEWEKVKKRIEKDREFNKFRKGVRAEIRRRN